VPGRQFALGVLWHPEEDEQSRVIGALVEEARARAGAGR
jgi:putative glutamine amidotransferase